MAISVCMHLLVGGRIIILKSWTLIGLSLIVFIILCGLGTWQIFRLKQKQALLAQIEMGIQEAPQQLSSMISPKAFTSTITSGHFLSDSTLLLKSKPFEGKVGQYVVMPFTTTTGQTVLVLRGWTDKRDRIGQNDRLFHLIGQIRYPATESWFHPKNTPGNWYRIDPVSMGKELKIKLAPYYILERHPPSPIRPLPQKPQIPNNHFAYIITWFSLAFALCVMLISYLRKECSRGGSNNHS